MVKRNSVVQVDPAPVTVATLLMLEGFDPRVHVSATATAPPLEIASELFDPSQPTLSSKLLQIEPVSVTIARLLLPLVSKPMKPARLERTPPLVMRSTSLKVLLPTT